MWLLLEVCGSIVHSGLHNIDHTDSRLYIDVQKYFIHLKLFICMPLSSKVSQTVGGIGNL